jgi:REP element-mobilizing transposase RayT
MTRLARAVIEGVPHHVTQRGNRRRPVTPRAAARATAGNVTARFRGRLERHRALVIAVCRSPVSAVLCVLRVLCVETPFA